MFRIRTWKSLFAWLALVATLAAALLPSISHALTSDRLGNIMRAGICAPSGMRYDLAPDDRKAPGQAAGHMDDCPYCRLASDLPALPVAVPAIAPLPAAAPRPTLFYRSPSPLFSWAAARPRGPPHLA